MVPFFEKTWFVWWILAILIILRWFHVISTGHQRHPSGDWEYPDEAKAHATRDLRSAQPPGMIHAKHG